MARRIATRPHVTLPEPFYAVACHHILLSSPSDLATGAMDRLKQAADQTKVIVQMPPQWLGMYSDFITKNAGAVGQVEGALRSLTYILPGTYSLV